MDASCNKHYTQMDSTCNSGEAVDYLDTALEQPYFDAPVFDLDSAYNLLKLNILFQQLFKQQQ